jgi:hypothetical protein
MPYDVFISYSSVDKPVADAAVAVLERSRIRCWVAPRDIMPGADWGASIIQGIRASRLMLIIFSSHSNSSDQVKREVERAVHQGIPIIPLRIENIEPTGSMEFFLSTPHWLDALSMPMEAHLAQLAQTVYLILHGPDSQPAPAPAPAPAWTPAPAPVPQWVPPTPVPPAGPAFPPWLIAVIIGGLLAMAGGLYLARTLLSGPGSGLPKITSLQFFEGGVRSEPRGKRAYATRFAATGTRYINWELNLEFPVKTAESKIEIEARWYKPDGLLMTTQNHILVLQQGWTTAFINAGWGNKEGGFFHPGTYRLELYVAGQKWTEGKFEVYDGEAPPSGYVEPIDATVTSLSFYETPAETTPKDQRQYRTHFSRSARYIDWELNLAYPKMASLTPFTIHQVWRRPNGELEVNQDIILSIQPGWTKSWHNWGWGTAKGGYWQPGTYRVDMYVDNRKIASGSFDIED